MSLDGNFEILISNHNISWRSRFLKTPITDKNMLMYRDFFQIAILHVTGPDVRDSVNNVLLFRQEC